MHAGTHKTGTTSIQRVLWQHADYLRKKGLLYPDGRVPFGPSEFAHHQFAHSLTGVSNAGLIEATAFATATFNTLRPGERVIISAEPIYRHQFGRTVQDYRIDLDTYWENRRRYLQGVRATLAAFDVEILLYFRARDRFAESWFWHCTREFGPQPPIDDFLRSFDPWFDYERQVATFRSVFRSVRIESYEDACASPGGLVAHFFRTIDCDPPPLTSEPREREGQYGGDAFGTTGARKAFLSMRPTTIPQ